MGKVDELDDVDVVALVLQNGGADGVGQERRETLLKQSVGEENVEVAAPADGLVDLVLAAGDGEDVLHAARDGVVQGVVGRGVAGVEGDEHVDVLIVEHIARHIGDDEAQTFVAVARGDLIAVRDHVLFQVVADDLRTHAALDGKIVVEHEREVRFSAAKVENGDLVAPVGAEGVVHKLDETVDLLVFVIFCLDDLELRRKNAEIDEGGDILALLQDVFLLAVVRGCGGAGRAGLGGAFVCAVRLADVLARLRLGAERDGAEEAVELLIEGLEQRAARNVAVRDLLPLLVFKLEEGLAAQGERPHGDARVADARDRLGEDELGERAETLGKVA